MSFSTRGMASYMAKKAGGIKIGGASGATGSQKRGTKGGSTIVSKGMPKGIKVGGKAC